MNYYLPEQCVLLDTVTQDRYAFDDRILMENAGRSCAQEIIRAFSNELLDHGATVLAGPGNNGGDGLVIARVLSDHGFRVRVIHLLPDTLEVKTDACRYHLNVLEKLGVTYKVVVIGVLDAFEKVLGHRPGICVDALFGVGARPPFDEFWLQVFERVNKRARFSVAIDHPSGYAANDGVELAASWIKPDMTCSIGLPKFSHFTHAGVEARGQLVHCDAGFPRKAVDSVEPFAKGIDLDRVSQWLQAPSHHHHKNVFGHLGVLAGSRLMPGALQFCTQAALRSGVGKVTVISDSKEGVLGFQRVLPAEVMYAVAENSKDLLSVIKERRIGGCVIGPGLALSKEVLSDWVIRLAKDVVLVLDAEVFRSLTKQGVEDAMSKDSQVAWIGHVGEQQMLWEKATPDEMFKESIALYKEWIQRFKNHVWLRKGTGSVVVSKDGIDLNESGNVGLAKGGSGDVLAGIIGALALRLPLPVAVSAGIWIHGSVADQICEREGGVNGVTPSALLERIPATFETIYTHADIV